MPDFDPRQYLAEKTAGASAADDFDPAKYLAEKTAQAAPPKGERLVTPEEAYPDKGVGHSATFGALDRLPGGKQAAALLTALRAKASGIPFGETYHQALGQFDREDAAAQAHHPLFHAAAAVPAFVLGAAALPGGAATQGAIYGLSGSGADDALAQGHYGEAAIRAGIAAPLGALLGKGTEVAGNYAGKAANTLLSGLLKPSEAAQLLRSRGVPLTLGQMNAGGFMSKLEEAGQHSALGGHAIADAQAAAREGWQNAVLNEARPIPGALAPGGPAEKLAAVYGDFTPAYQAAGEAPVLAAAGKGGKLVAVRDAFTKAVEDPSVYATDTQLSGVRRFLDNQVSLVERAMENKGDAPLKASALLAMRSNIRGAIRDAAGQQDFAAAKLLGNAEKSLTEGLESQLPKPALEALKAADSRYGVYKTVEDAVRRGGDQPNGFTPSQLSAAVRAASDRGHYARGGGGTLRELAQAGKEVLDARQPATGAKLLTLPLGLNHAAAPLAALANRPSVARALLGEAAFQQLLARTGARLSPHMPPTGLRNALTPYASSRLADLLAPRAAPAPVPMLAGGDSRNSQTLADLLHGTEAP